ncbi:hypothetical protein, partial [Psychrobacter sp. HY3-MNA-CIBAN-0198]
VKFYQENNRAESLKQAMMMTYDEWGPEGKGRTNIENHESAMLGVLSAKKYELQRSVELLNNPADN